MDVIFLSRQYEFFKNKKGIVFDYWAQRSNYWYNIQNTNNYKYSLFGWYERYATQQSLQWYLFYVALKANTKNRINTIISNIFVKIQTIMVLCNQRVQVCRIWIIVHKKTFTNICPVTVFKLVYMHINQISHKTTQTMRVSSLICLLCCKKRLNLNRKTKMESWIHRALSLFFPVVCTLFIWQDFARYVLDWW